MISRIIKVVKCNQPRLITLSSTLIIPDITKIETITASLETIQVLALFSIGVLSMRTAHNIICRYNWIADYTIIMLEFS